MSGMMLFRDIACKIPIFQTLGGRGGVPKSVNDKIMHTFTTSGRSLLILVCFAAHTHLASLLLNVPLGPACMSTTSHQRSQTKNPSAFSQPYQNLRASRTAIGPARVTTAYASTPNPLLVTNYRRIYSHTTTCGALYHAR